MALTREEPTEKPMGRPKSGVKLVQVQISEEALAVARSVVGFTGEAISAYLTRVVLHQGRVDRDVEYRKALDKEASGHEPDAPGNEPE